MLDSHRGRGLSEGNRGRTRIYAGPAINGDNRRSTSKQVVGRPTASTSAANSAPELDSPSVSTPAIEAAAVVM